MIHSFLEGVRFSNHGASNEVCNLAVFDNGLAVLSVCAALARPLCLTEISTTNRVWPANPCVLHPLTRSNMWWTASLTGLMKVKCCPPADSPRQQSWKADSYFYFDITIVLSSKTEEVLLQYAAHWWSVDGARLAYLSINNSVTPVMEIPHFLGGLYPSNVLFPYPKVKTAKHFAVTKCRQFRKMPLFHHLKFSLQDYKINYKGKNKGFFLKQLCLSLNQNSGLLLLAWLKRFAFKKSIHFTFFKFIWSGLFPSCGCLRRLAQVSHQSVCLWWICTVQLTLWKWCLRTPSEPGSTPL